MTLQTPIISLFIVLAALVLCDAFYIEEPLYQTNAENYYYPLHDGRLIKTRHEHFGLMTRANRATLHSSRPHGMVSVDDFGAKADGRDDTEAFKKAWNEACSGGAVLVVPENKVYHLKPITFSGPCQPNSAFMIYGTIEAWPQISAYEEDRQHWIVFDSVTDFKVDGGGTFNGNGCDFLSMQQFESAKSEVQRCTQMHVTFEKCFNVIVSNILIRAPGDSPNTDGIHVAETQNIVIRNSDIGTDITCGPGHGISIGSLGADNSEAEVFNVVVNRATLKGTSNGVRIKTWQGGSGYARNIKFMNIAMQNVTNPIIIDQYYCDQAKPCQEQASAVRLSNVLYQNIRGTSASEVAIKFDCSRSVPCREIYVQDVILEPQGSGEGTIATCENVRYVNRGKLFPQCSP
ncbi:Pectin lyase fold/virulence factor [Sesbania bispinosa]|nr:Pectin lyase fold/virulence factor [Sesbania bispinosa]